MSDSDELSTTTAGRKLRRDSSVRKKRCSLGSSSTIDVAAAANSAAAESDSLNENLSSAAIQGGCVMSRDGMVPRTGSNLGTGSQPSEPEPNRFRTGSSNLLAEDDSKQNQ